MIEGELQQLVNLVVKFLNSHEIEYVLIGGIAYNIWGLPRMTNDVDAVVAIPPRRFKSFIKIALEAGFEGDQNVLQSKLRKSGVCRFSRLGRHVDFIMGFSDFEKAVFLRKKKIELSGCKAYVASAEDIILYKLISLRPIDLIDIKNIFMSQSKSLDASYMRSRAKVMQHELHRADITANLEKYLAEIT